MFFADVRSDLLLDDENITRLADSRNMQEIRSHGFDFKLNGFSVGVAARMGKADIIATVSSGHRGFERSTIAADV
jgi:hypothetical protein